MWMKEPIHYVDEDCEDFSFASDEDDGTSCKYPHYKSLVLKQTLMRLGFFRTLP